MLQGRLKIPRATAKTQDSQISKYLFKKKKEKKTTWVSLVAPRLKRLPAMRETWVRSLGQEDPLEKEKATHASTLAWKIPWTEKSGRLQSMGLQRV